MACHRYLEERLSVATVVKEYLHVENQEDSDDGIVYPSEEMQRKSDGKGEDTSTANEEKSEKTSALQAAWNVLNLIQGQR